MQSESENEIDETKQDVEATIFKIAVMRRVWTQIMELIDTDGRSLEKFKLKPDYVRFFQAELTAYENMPIALRDRKTRVYNLKKKKTTNFLVAYTTCTLCCRDGVKYNFVLKDKPLDSDLTVEILVKRFGVHNHSDTKGSHSDKSKVKKPKEKKTVDATDHTLLSNPPTTTTPKPHVSQTLPKTNIKIENAKSESPECYSKLFKAYESKDPSCQDLFSNLMFIANSQKSCITATNVLGFMRNLKIFDEFSFIMHSEHQLKSIELIPAEHRVLHIGLTGKLVKINAAGFKYQKLLNHFVMLKDSRSTGLRNSKTLLISEMVSSSQNAYQLADFYRCVQKNFNDINPKKLLEFNVIVTDFLWDNIHAICDVFNNETVNDYCQRVFTLSKEELDLFGNNTKRSWVIACASHTINKFIRLIRKSLKDAKIKMLACLVFSLMLNSVDLNEISNYFRLACHAFLNEFRTELNYNCLRELQSLIMRRPRDEADILKCLNSQENRDNNLDHSVNKSTFVYKQIDEGCIKENSPFKKHFEDIEANTRIEIAAEISKSQIANVYHCPTFIALLQHAFMPFAFVWVSFSLKKSESRITRMTNKVLDQLITQKKNLVKSDADMLTPAQYAMIAYPQVKSKTEQFVKFQQDEIQERMDDFRFEENEQYYGTMVDEFINCEREDAADSLNIDLNAIEFDFF